MSNNKFWPLTVSKINRQTSDCVEITFDIPQSIKSEFTFLSGQYLTLKTEINGEDIRRSYSICSAPHEDSLA